MWHQHHQDEHHLQRRQEPACHFQSHGRQKGLGVLLMQGRYLPVHGVKLPPVPLHERPRPLLDERHAAQHVHHAHRQSLLIPHQEEPDAQPAEHGRGSQHQSHPDGHGLREQVQHDADGPEAEMGEDVGHHVKNHRRRRPLGSYPRRELHDAVRLAAHQPAGSGVVEREPRHGNLVEPPKAHLPHGAPRRPCVTVRRLLRRVSRLTAADDQVPRRGVEHIQHRPQGYDGKEPIARMGEPVPHFGEIELGDHDDEND